MIWYEAPETPEFDSRILFTRLNVGRIALTDAELVKALLLSRIERKHETAAQWDSIERDLHRSGGVGFRHRHGRRRADADQPPAGHHRRHGRRRSGRPRPAAVPHLRNATAPHRGVARGSVERGRRPALAGPGLVRRPRPLPQDRLSRRHRRVVVPRAGRVGAAEHQDRVRHRTQWPHPRQPQALEERRRVADVPDPPRRPSGRSC